MKVLCLRVTRPLLLYSLMRNQWFEKVVNMLLILPVFKVVLNQARKNTMINFFTNQANASQFLANKLMYCKVISVWVRSVIQFATGTNFRIYKRVLLLSGEFCSQTVSPQNCTSVCMVLVLFMGV